MDEQTLRLRIGTLVDMAMTRVRRDWDNERARAVAARGNPRDAEAATQKIPPLERKQAEEAAMIDLAVQIGVELVLDFHRIAEALEVVAHGTRPRPS